MKVGIIGFARSGKTTVFNALTGARVTMGNWPGTTVEVARGVWRTNERSAACSCEVCDCASSQRRLELTLVDLPGA